MIRRCTRGFVCVSSVHSPLNEQGKQDMTNVNNSSPDAVCAVKPAPNKAHAASPRGRRVLVMDDEESVRNVIGDILATFGCRAELTKNGEAAIALYKKAKSSGEPFDAVIIDLNIPVGMNGMEAMKKLLDFDPEVNAIVTSGDFTDPGMADFKAFGFKEALPKPFKPAELEKALLPLLH